jgi:hypothetical protein
MERDRPRGLSASNPRQTPTQQALDEKLPMAHGGNQVLDMPEPRLVKMRVS